MGAHAASATAAVVDGGRVLLSRLGMRVVPPPTFKAGAAPWRGAAAAAVAAIGIVAVAHVAASRPTLPAAAATAAAAAAAVDGNGTRVDAGVSGASPPGVVLVLYGDASVCAYMDRSAPLSAAGPTFGGDAPPAPDGDVAWALPGAWRAPLLRFRSPVAAAVRGTWVLVGVLAWAAAVRERVAAVYLPPGGGGASRLPKGGSHRLPRGGGGGGHLRPAAGCKKKTRYIPGISPRNPG